MHMGAPALPHREDDRLEAPRRLRVDGFAATQAIRERGLPHIHVVALTANAIAGEREACLGTGMDDFVVRY